MIYITRYQFEQLPVFARLADVPNDFVNSFLTARHKDCVLDGIRKTFVIYRRCGARGDVIRDFDRRPARIQLARDDRALI